MKQTFSLLRTVLLPAFVSISISCGGPPSLVLKKQEAPVFQPAGDWNKIKDLHRFCIIGVQSQERNQASLPLGQGITYRLVDKYLYADGIEGIIQQTIIDNISRYFPGVTFVDRNNLSTILKEKTMDLTGITTDDLQEIKKILAIDCLIEAKVNYARSMLVANTDATGGYRYCYVPEASITVEAISTQNAEIIASKTTNLNMLQFLKQDYLSDECPSGDINWLTQQATIYSLSAFISPVQWELLNLTNVLSTEHDTISYVSGLKKLLLLEPDCMKCLASLGWINLCRGNIEEFCKFTSAAYSKINLDDPSYVWIQFNFAYTLILNNDIDGSEKIVRHAFQIGKNKEFFEVLKNDLALLKKFTRFREGAKALEKRLF